MGRPPLRLAMLLAFVVVGCGAFDTREPEPPSDEPTIPFDTPSTEQKVLDNIERTMEGRGSTNYRRSLSSDFRYEPPITDLELSGLLRQPWTYQDEDRVWSQVLTDARAQNIQVIWTWGGERSLQTVEGESNKKYYDDLVYACVFDRADSSRTYSGKVDLYLVETNGVFSVYKWVDIEDDSGNDTLGWLRYEGSVFGSGSTF